MPCNYPLTGYRSEDYTESGKRLIVFDRTKVRSSNPEIVKVPCGECVGCRLEYSRQWAIRCMHEAECHDNNCFITLTYDQAFVPMDYSLIPQDFTKFIKRLRKYLEPLKAASCYVNPFTKRKNVKKFHDPFPLRYFHCGEYGAKSLRPHFHALIFGYDFPDKEFYTTRNGNRLYTSEILNSLWSDPESKSNYGHAIIGDVTFESAAYVARYVTKKAIKDGKEEFYELVKPEYVTMSRRPAIGKLWYEEFKDEVYRDDEVVIRKDITCKPPKYYDKLYSLTDPEKYATLKKYRMEKSKNNPNNHPKRLHAREQVKKARVNMYERSL